jgi:hypothetical protein
MLMTPARPKVENGDLNWVVPGKLMAFSGPPARPTDYAGFRAMVPEDYWEYFRRRRVGAVVRLNKKVCGRGGPGLGVEASRLGRLGAGGSGA